MPSSQQAILRHALLYLRQLVSTNDGYLAGGDEMLNALKSFDMDWGNIAAAQSRLAEITAKFNEADLDDHNLRHLLDFCNSYPDAGAYIISLRLPPLERIAWLESALGASQILKNELTTQAHLGNIGLAYMELGEVQKAIEYFERALRLAEQIGETLHQGIWAGNLGNAHASLGQHEKAVEYHQKHLSVALEQNNLRNQGHAHANLGVSYAAMSRQDQALQSYQAHLAIARQLNDARETCHALINLGFSQYDLGNLEDAKAALEEAASLSQALNDHALLALAYGGMADVWIERQEYSQAMSCFLQVKKRPIYYRKSAHFEKRKIKIII
jgi:tetratricopeptide (TPR) repeat protein